MGRFDCTMNGNFLNVYETELKVFRGKQYIYGRVWDEECMENSARFTYRLGRLKNKVLHTRGSQPR